MLFPMIRFCQYLGGVQPPHLLGLTNKLLILKKILQNMFKICRLGDYCVTDTSNKFCVTEYGLCVAFVTCVQCTLKSHVSTHLGDEIALRDYMPSLLKPSPLL